MAEPAKDFSKQSKSLAEAALDYAADGWPVFPCVAGAKNPLTAGGFHDATADTATVQAWWREYPDANIGLALPEGLVAVDVDSQESMAALGTLGFDLPATANQRTPRGWHFIYSANGAPVRQTAGEISPGIDTRVGGKGYLVIPPSRLNDGGDYHWETPLDWERIALAPRWLTAHFAKRRTAAAAPSGLAAEAIPQSTRNNTLFSLAGSMRKRGMTEAAIEAALLEENRQRCEPPLLEKEVQSIAASVARYAPSQVPSEPLKTVRVVGVREFLQMDLPPRELILSPILRKKDLAMIHAWRGTGKTWVGLGIAAAVAAGGRFLRWEAQEPLGVLYVDGEMPAEAIQERLALIIQSCDLEPDRLKIITPDLLEHGVPNLATPEGQEQIEQHLEGVDLLILDHQSALFRGMGSENEAESWEPAQEFMLRLRRKEVSCVLIHHSGKGGQQRGTSKREDVLDLVASLRHPKNYSPTEGARFEVHFEKARAAFGKDVEPFEARLQTDANGSPVWTVRDLDKQTYAETVRLAKEGLNGKEIADELDKNKSTISRHLKTARELGDLS